MNDAPKPRIGLCEGEGHDWHHPVLVTLRKGLDPKMPESGRRPLITLPLDDDGRHVGLISVLAGCAVQVSIESQDGSERSVYYFNPAELFEAVQLAHVAGQPGFELPTVAVPVPEPPKVADAVVPDGSVEYRIIGGDTWGGTEMFEVSRGMDLERQWAMLRETMGKDVGQHHFRAQVRHVGPWVDHDDPMVSEPKETDHG
jgi:hypothetical protein